MNNVPDDVDGIAYGTVSKGRMDRRVMPAWFSEPRLWCALPNNRLRQLLVDNCSGHVEKPEIEAVSDKTRMDINYFPSNANHLVQACDSLFIQKIKREWTTHSETYNMTVIKANK